MKDFSAISTGFFEGIRQFSEIISFPMDNCPNIGCSTPPIAIYDRKSQMILNRVRIDSLPKLARNSLARTGICFTLNNEYRFKVKTFFCDIGSKSIGHRYRFV